MRAPGVVLCFGCPRSGTTLLYKVLGQAEGPGLLVEKLMEDAECHPAQSDLGLIRLARMLRRRPFVLVRIKRHPMEVVESMLYARTDRDRFGGLATNDDARIVQWIRRESDGVMAQRGTLTERMSARTGSGFVEVRYEDLAQDGTALDAVSGLLPGSPTFMVPDSPVRAGRMSDGAGQVSTPAQRAWFRRELADIIEREGYE